MVSQISELEVAGGTITAKRQTEFGYDRIQAPLPAVLAVADSLNEPRYPSLKGIMGAKKKPQDVVSLSDIGVEADRAGQAGSRTTVTSLSPPPSRGDTVKIEDDGSAAQKIMEFLVERKFA
jgi:electron transfer flavoprotein beta subunit